VTFTRLSGPVLGTIANEIEGDGDDLQLRFSFAMIIVGAPGGSEQERAFAQTMTADYMNAVIATRDAMRKLAMGATA